MPGPRSVRRAVYGKSMPAFERNPPPVDHPRSPGGSVGPDIILAGESQKTFSGERIDLLGEIVDEQRLLLRKAPITLACVNALVTCLRPFFRDSLSGE